MSIINDISNNISNLFSNKIKDISNSSFNLNNITKRIENIHKLLLEDCKKENIKFNNLNNNNNYKNNINFNDIIKDILKNMSDKRKTNKTKYFSNLTNALDNKYINNNSDITENNLVKYKYKNTNKFSISNYQKDLDTNFNRLLNTTNMFKYHTTDNLFTKTKTNNIYIPSSKVNPPLPITIKKTYVTINTEINNLDDLIKLTETYPLKFDVVYNINMVAIHNIKKPVIELKNMVGMRKLKDAILDQILYFIQEFHTHSKNNDFMHTVIYGPPGTGKTETAKIIGKIFSNLGILKNKTFIKATRADLIAGYLGQTALKTRDMIEKSIGGVLFIDEAYALGNVEKRDSFAKECIDTLCEGLSDHKDKLMVIIAGYENELKNCFFAYNQGLDSRFTWRFNTDDYKYDELFLIFQKKVKDIGWVLHDKVNKTWFIDKMDYFKFYGRDIETLLAKTKIAHGRRVFCLKSEEKTMITLKDLDKGFERFLDNNEVKERKNNISNQVIKHMYL